MYTISKSNEMLNNFIRGNTYKVYTLLIDAKEWAPFFFKHFNLTDALSNNKEVMFKVAYTKEPEPSTLYTVRNLDISLFTPKVQLELESMILKYRDDILFKQDIEEWDSLALVDPSFQYFTFYLSWNNRGNLPLDSKSPLKYGFFLNTNLATSLEITNFLAKLHA